MFGYECWNRGNNNQRYSVESHKTGIKISLSAAVASEFHRNRKCVETGR